MNFEIPEQIQALPKLVIAASNIMTLRVNKLSSFTFTLN